MRLNGYGDNDADDMYDDQQYNNQFHNFELHNMNHDIRLSPNYNNNMNVNVNTNSITSNSILKQSPPVNPVKSSPSQRSPQIQFNIPNNFNVNNTATNKYSNSPGASAAKIWKDKVVQHRSQQQLQQQPVPPHNYNISSNSGRNRSNYLNSQQSSPYIQQNVDNSNYDINFNYDNNDNNYNYNDNVQVSPPPMRQPRSLREAVGQLQSSSNNGSFSSPRRY